MPDNEANDTAHQSPPQYAWNEEREAQLNALRISAQTSTDDLIKYLRLRAERAGIKSYFLRAETAYLQKMAEAASERLPGDDPKVWQAEQDLGWTRFDWIYGEKAFHKQQSLLNLAKNYFETPAERRMFGESEFRALGNELSDLIEMQSGRLSEFSSIDPDKPALPALLEERVARMKSGSTFQKRIGTHLGGAIAGNDEAISWVADRWQGLPPEHRERAKQAWSAVNQAVELAGEGVGWIGKEVWGGVKLFWNEAGAFPNARDFFRSRATSAWNGVTGYLVEPLARQRDRLINYVLGPSTAETPDKVVGWGPANTAATLTGEAARKLLGSRPGGLKVMVWQPAEFKVAV